MRKQNFQCTFMRIVIQIQGKDHTAGTLVKCLYVLNTSGRNTCLAALVGTISTVLHLGEQPFYCSRWHVTVLPLKFLVLYMKTFGLPNSSHSSKLQWLSLSVTYRAQTGQHHQSLGALAGFSGAHSSLRARYLSIRPHFGCQALIVPKCILLSVEACTLPLTSQND